MLQPSLFDQPAYFNTTNLVADELHEATEDTKAQNAEILSLFRKHRNLSPGQAHKRLNEKYLLTSVRRAITTLTKENLLTKTSVKVKGQYGKPEYVWTLTLNDN